MPISAIPRATISMRCSMGLAGDAMAVVNQDGKVHGLDSLYVVDASIFPATTRANTNLPTIAVAEKLPAGLMESGPPPI